MSRSRWLSHLVGASALTVAYAALITDWSTATPGLRFEGINRARYMLSAFPLFGLIVGELAWSVRAHGWRSQLRAGVALGALCLVAIARLALHVPLSGHLALATFGAVWCSSLPAGGVRTSYRLVFLVGCAAFAWVHDAFTSVTAVMAGAALGVAGFGWPWRDQHTLRSVD